MSNSRARKKQTVVRLQEDPDGNGPATLKNITYIPTYAVIRVTSCTGGNTFHVDRLINDSSSHRKQATLASPHTLYRSEWVSASV